MSNIHYSVCTVIPPHVYRNVARRADDGDLRDRAEATLDVIHGLAAGRGRRRFAAATAIARAKARKRRYIYDAEHRLILPGNRVMAEGQKRSGDVEVNEAYDGAGSTYDFYDHVFDRQSIDGAGMRLDSTVHYGHRFDNAMWNGSQMIYGDGDGRLFNRFTCALDVIAHELSHGVTQAMSGLDYAGEPGAINEHLSDAFGIMVKQYTLGQHAVDSDWLIGAGLLGPKVHGKAVRSMAAPGTAYDDPILGRDPQPAHMRDYYYGTDDNGGVHINSGILNHAFYRAAMAIGGATWEVLGKVWYEVLKGCLYRQSQIREFAQATVVTAARLFGTEGRAHRAIHEAWDAVGVQVPKLPGQHAALWWRDAQRLPPRWRHFPLGFNTLTNTK